MSDQKHGDTGQCKHCGQPVRFWDVNPNHLGAHWLHAREPVSGERYDPRYCNATMAEVEP